MFDSHLKIHSDGWGSGTPYNSYQEYWEFEVIAALVMQWKDLTGENIIFPNVQLEDERIVELMRKYQKEIEKIGGISK